MSIKNEKIEEKRYIEQSRIVTIRNFLRANAGLSYTSEEIEKELGIVCADNLLGYRHDVFVRGVGIKTKRVIEKDGAYCGSVNYYSCNEKLLKRLWKRKGEK